jgi:hypothetical protein
MLTTAHITIEFLNFCRKPILPARLALLAVAANLMLHSSHFEVNRRRSLRQFGNR